jgi:hypothetical protein
MTQKCGAERPPIRPLTWECMGVGLSVVMRGPEGVPVVVPTVLLGVIGEAARQVMDRQGGPTPFTGGDHIHLTLPDKPSADDMIRRNNLRLV